MAGANMKPTLAPGEGVIQPSPLLSFTISGSAVGEVTKHFSTDADGSPRFDAWNQLVNDAEKIAKGRGFRYTFSVSPSAAAFVLQCLMLPQTEISEEAYDIVCEVFDNAVWDYSGEGR